MIDHFTLSVADMARSKEFYTRALQPLGYTVLMDFGELVGFGDGRKPYFWLKASATPTQPMHIAFEARSRAAVDAFHAAALQAGARDDGSPGVRSEYHPNYYGAFVVELNGHPIEAVSHLPHKKVSAQRVAQKAGAPKSRPKGSPRKAAGKKAIARRKSAGRKRR
jgi:catechol 2,3-dioxygenase-like lactoylglutathione lyase family enzyme